ncbi:hypothetical protein HanRHA438_Chr17g0838191 [Helianthus annuus]|uniref:Uncharacterized protein n=1 Tax=Helianthus annuus TaxID=4232 RepID=A0A251RU55_HELAN|nr:hypothetical protein HanXRQr2_Chr17g0827671 [Helianthus annuus]KAJ0430877.1 hypothetical protein HanHA300_Chr17g0674081 [Helianthus annuus]KAJ0449334.1 hypothetical protein HanHA89_Chr17g0727281 [Helianthus annuus]KAJ0828525.1 hypothetical protein HanRHA438_Chr17g0838191 [Helianthus annuus]
MVHSIYTANRVSSSSTHFIHDLGFLQLHSFCLSFIIASLRISNRHQQVIFLIFKCRLHQDLKKRGGRRRR